MVWEPFHFKLFLMLLPIPDPCGRSTLVATEATQVLQSPEFPQNYPTSMRCRWTITAPVNTSVTVHFDDMDLQTTRGCTNDSLTIEVNDEVNIPNWLGIFIMIR